MKTTVLLVCGEKKKILVYVLQKQAKKKKILTPDFI